MVEKFHGKLSSIVAKAVFLGLVGLLFISPLLAEFLHLSSWLEVFLISAAGLVGFCSLLITATLYGLMSFSSISIYASTNVVIKLLLTVALIPVADHRDIGHSYFDVAEIIRCQFNVSRADVLVKA